MRCLTSLSLAALFFLAGPARGVILYRTGDPQANTTAPTGDLAGSGWQFQGLWGGFTGTPIAPQYFISAAHIGQQGSFFYNGATYTVVASYLDPESDLQILRVAETFPSFAPLYSRLDEVGQRLAEFGRGTQRGAEIVLSAELHGWAWGAGDGVLRWGENIVSGTYATNAQSDLLVANFDQAGLPNECHLSAGDSGGAAFINDAGVWKLAGINYAVDGPFYTDAMGNGAFTAALFDARGFYAHDGNAFTLITGDNPVPSAFYPTRISRRLPWIATTIAAPVLARDGSDITFTYDRLLIPASDLLYTIEQTKDFVMWEAAAVTEEILATNGSVQTVRAKVPLASFERLILRLRVAALTR